MSLKLAVVSAFPPGLQSLNEYGLHLANEFAARSDVSEVVIIADKLETPAPELDLDPKITVKRVWSFNKISSVPKILKAMRASGCDAAVWNLQTASFGDKEVPAALGLIGPYLARLAGIPSGVIAHNILEGVDFENTTLKGQPIRQAIVSKAGKVVTGLMLSANYTTVTLSRYCDILAQSHPGKDVHMVPHGTFDTDREKLSNAVKRKNRIVTMGKFGTYKKLETLLGAFDIIRKREGLEDYDLIIGGTDHPNAIGYLDQVAQSRKNDPQVHFHGYIAEDDIPAFFGEAKLSVFDYSATTGSSGVLHQTASYGAAPVFPFIGDFVDVCRNEGLGGFNYQPNDPQDMASSLIHALENPEIVEALARTNKIASLEYPLAKVADFHVQKLASLTSKALTERRGGSLYPEGEFAGARPAQSLDA